MKQELIVTRYKLHSCSSYIRKDIRIALVADLHDRKPDELLFLLRKEPVDFILAAGDLMERREEGVSEWTEEAMQEWQGTKGKWPVSDFLANAADAAAGWLFPAERQERSWSEENGRYFLREASKVAPVYLGVGNHEWYYLPKDYEVMQKCHIRLLDNKDVVAERETAAGKGCILIGGLSTRYDLEWLKRFSRKEGYKILICHHPEYYLRFIKGTRYDNFDLIVSGHSHGGQWRIGGRGVYAPGQGMFSKYAYGIHNTAKGAHDGKLIVSAGCVNTVNVPRWGNPCELVIIEMKAGRLD